MAKASTDLRALALKIVEGKVYGTWEVPSDLTMSVFMPMIAIDPKTLKNVAHIYAIVGEDKAGLWGVNGYPMFFSCRYLTKSEWKKIIPLIDKAKKAREKFLNSK